MNNISKTIQYADYSWNPISGCYNTCPYCYARTIANRFKGSKAFPNGFEPTFHPKRLAEPGRLKKPSRIFVCNMGDIFAPQVHGQWLSDTLQVMRNNQQHTFLLLTKYPQFIHSNVWVNNLKQKLKNVWIGVSVTKQADFWRVRFLKENIPSEVIRFISFEPLLEPVKVDLKGIDWIIIGGQTGRKKFLSPWKWVWDLQTQADKLGISVFLKDNLELYTGISPRCKVIQKEFPK